MPTNSVWASTSQSEWILATILQCGTREGLLIKTEPPQLKGLLYKTQEAPLPKEGNLTMTQV